jgi:hypothetical protein
VAELGEGPTELRDGPRHTAGVLIHNGGPGLEAVATMQNEDLLVFVVSPDENSASPPNSPENNFFSLTLSVTIGGRLACFADTRVQLATAVHSNTSATAHAYIATASVGMKEKTASGPNAISFESCIAHPLVRLRCAILSILSSRHKKNAA